MIVSEFVSKHLKNIYRGMNSKTGAMHRIKEFVAEICIIVLAITISIWFHGMSEHRHQQHEVREFLKDLQTDLRQEVEKQTHYHNGLKNIDSVFAYMQTLNEDSIKQMEKNGRDINIVTHPIFRQTSSGNFEAFKSSGKIGYIENKKLKGMIMQYYQENIPVTIRTEEMYNEHINLFSRTAITKPDKRAMFLPQESKMLFSLTREAIANCAFAYQRNLQLLWVMLGEIEKEDI